MDEPVLQETNRLAAFPIDPEYRDIWANYKRQQASLWEAEKINFKHDKHEFTRLPKDIQSSILMVLGFFANSDEIVEENLKKRFLDEIRNPEIQCAYTVQAYMENVHSETYNMTIDILVPVYEDKNKLFRSVEHHPSVRDKAEWARKWISSDQPFSVRCVAFACVEGILFSSSFAFIDWLKTQGYRLDGLYESNDYISADEARHTELACLIYKKILHKVPRSKVKKIISEAIDVELAFVRDVLPEGYTGMNESLMTQHVKHCANILANELGYPFMFGNTSCPFSFMVKRNLYIKDNFFERDGVQYTAPGVGADPEENAFVISENF